MIEETLEQRSFQLFSSTAKRRVAHTGGQGNDSETSLEYARRLVAAWNACAGIPTETLEYLPTRDLSIKDALNSLEDTRARADALAAWLETAEGLLRGPEDAPQLWRIEWLATLIQAIDEGTLNKAREEDPDAFATMMFEVKTLIEGARAFLEAKP